MKLVNLLIITHCIPVFGENKQNPSVLLSHPGPGTFSGPRLTTPYLRGRRSLAPTFRSLVSANRTTGRTCARPRTTTGVPPITTPCWCMVSARVWQFNVVSFLSFPKWMKSLLHRFFSSDVLFFNLQSSISGNCPLFWIISCSIDLFFVAMLVLVFWCLFFFFYLSFWEMIQSLLILLSPQYLWSLAILALGTTAIKSEHSSHLSFSSICFPDSLLSRKPPLNLLCNWFYRVIDSKRRHRRPCSDTSHQHHYSGYI